MAEGRLWSKVMAEYPGEAGSTLLDRYPPEPCGYGEAGYGKAGILRNPLGHAFTLHRLIGKNGTGVIRRFS
jgi:hypothetical protein